jgi:hypothetical protein
MNTFSGRACRKLGIESGVKELLEVFKRLVSDGRRFNRVVFQTHGSPETIGPVANSGVGRTMGCAGPSFTLC